MTTPDEQVDGPVLAALDIGTNSFHLVVARPVGGDRFETLTREKEVVRLGHGGGDMKELSRRRHRAGHRLPAPDAAHRRQLRGDAAGGGDERGARGHQRRRVPRPGPHRGRHRGRGHLRRRGGPAHPPRRAAGRAGVRPPAAPRRHRRRLDRAADRREGRDPRRAQLQARRRPADRPLLPGRHGDAEGGRRRAASTSAASSATSSARSTSTASTSPWRRRGRPRPSPTSPTR